MINPRTTLGAFSYECDGQLMLLNLEAASLVEDLLAHAPPSMIERAERWLQKVTVVRNTMGVAEW